jgi:phage terminase small subunit
MVKYMSELGLTPSSRARLSVNVPSEEDRRSKEIEAKYFS